MGITALAPQRATAAPLTWSVSQPAVQIGSAVGLTAGAVLGPWAYVKQAVDTGMRESRGVHAAGIAFIGVLGALIGAGIVNGGMQITESVMSGK